MRFLSKQSIKASRCVSLSLLTFATENVPKTKRVSVSFLSLFGLSFARLSSCPPPSPPSLDRIKSVLSKKLKKNRKLFRKIRLHMVLSAERCINVWRRRSCVLELTGVDTPATPVLMKGRLQIVICKYNRAVVKVDRFASDNRKKIIELGVDLLRLDLSAGSDLGSSGLKGNPSINSEGEPKKKKVPHDRRRESKVRRS